MAGVAFRDRIKGLRRVKASALRPHPQNWRRHGEAQRSVLSAALTEIGFAGAVIAREMSKGRYQIIDGHLRADLAEDSDVPVLVVDLTAKEAKQLLAIYDPIARLAQTDADALQGLVDSIDYESKALASFAEGLAPEPLGDAGGEPSGDGGAAEHTWSD